MRRIVVSRYNRRCMWIRQSSRSHVAEDVQFRFDRGWRRLRRRNPDRREFGFCAPRQVTGRRSKLSRQRSTPMARRSPRLDDDPKVEAVWRRLAPRAGITVATGPLQGWLDTA